MTQQRLKFDQRALKTSDVMTPTPVCSTSARTTSPATPTKTRVTSECAVRMLSLPLWSQTRSTILPPSKVLSCMWICDGAYTSQDCCISLQK